MTAISFGVAISEEILGDSAPVPFQGGVLDGITEAAARGFDDVELHIRDPHMLDARAIGARAANEGVRIAAIGTGLEYSKNHLCLTSDDVDVRRRAREAMRRHIDFAAQFNAVVFIGLIRGTASSRSQIPHCLNLLADELSAIQEFADQMDVTTGFEPVAYYFSTLLNSTEETLDYLGRHGLDTVGLLLDTHHITLEDPSQGCAFAQAATRITHIHASDSNRRYPGAGNINWREVLASIKQAAYSGSVSLEVLPYPDGARAAERGLAHLKHMWNTLP